MAGQPRRHAAARRRRGGRPTRGRKCGRDGNGGDLGGMAGGRRAPPETGHTGGGDRGAGPRRGAALRGDAGRAYFVTTPSKVTLRGTMRPAVRTVNRRSENRLRVRIFTFAIPLPPPSCAPRAFCSEGCWSRARPQNPKTALV